MHLQLMHYNISSSIADITSIWIKRTIEGILPETYPSPCCVYFSRSASKRGRIGTFRRAERFYSSYIATYIEREFDRFLRLCALRAGQLTSLNPMAAELGISASTAKSWFDALIASHIISLVEPYHTNLSKRPIKTSKFYFTDTGLQCALAGLRSKEELQNSPLLGPIFEAHCFGQILGSFQNRAIRPRIAFFRDHFGHELTLS